MAVANSNAQALGPSSRSGLTFTPGAAGTYMVVVLSLAAARTVTPPTGFNARSGPSGSPTNVYIFDKVADGTEGASISFSFSSAVVCSATYVAFTGADPVSPSRSLSTSDDGTVDTTYVVTGASGLTAGDMVLYVALVSTASNPTITIPGGTTATSLGSGIAGYSLLPAVEAVTGATTTTKNFTGTLSLASVGVTVAVAAAAAARSHQMIL